MEQKTKPKPEMMVAGTLRKSKKYLLIALFVLVVLAVMGWMARDHWLTGKKGRNRRRKRRVR